MDSFERWETKDFRSANVTKTKFKLSKVNTLFSLNENTVFMCLKIVLTKLKTFLI